VYPVVSVRTAYPTNIQTSCLECWVGGAGYSAGEKPRPRPQEMAGMIRQQRLISGLSRSWHFNADHPGSVARTHGDS